MLRRAARPGVHAMAKAEKVVQFPVTQRGELNEPRSEAVQARLDAEAFYACCLAAWPAETLTALTERLSPCAVKILLEIRDERERRGST
jgi:hypothetical protein